MASLMRIPRPAAASILLCALGAPAAAQPVDADSPGAWLAFLTPDRLMRGVIQQGLLAARTQADLTYGDLGVSLGTGEVRLTDLTVWPFLDWDEEGECEIAVAEIVLGLPPLGQTDRLDLRLDVAEIEVPAACLPPEQRAPMALLGLEALAAPHLGLDLTYDVASSGAELSVEAAAAGVARIGIDATFDYLFFETDDRGEPVPVAILERAALAVRDDGALAAASETLPPPLRDADGAAQFIDGMYRTSPFFGDAAADALKDELIAAWTAVLRGEADRLTLRLAPAEPVYLPPEGWDDPAEIIADLAPTLAAGRAPIPERIDPATLSAALGDPNAVTGDEARRVADALMTGRGAPRDRAAAATFLSARDAPDPAMRMMAAEALLAGDPAAAYGHALEAAAGGASGAAALLDRIEDRIGLEAALAAQPGADAAEGPADMARVRALLSGRGEVRSYAGAAVLARVAAAEGEPGAAAALRRLDRLGETAPEAWAEVEAAAAARARDLWAGGE